ncbi:HlyD family efflux transporter periplasmic adaptor subunit [Gemmiger sp.]
MAKLYRKSVIDRLSSPEQLDRMIVIASPQLWLAALGAALIVVVALVWSIVGRLPSKVDANGIFVSDQGVASVYADVTGTVDTVYVAEGDTVTDGQLLLTVSGEDTQKQIDDLTQRIAAVQTVTLTSTDDEANSDTQQLLNLKTQYETGSTGADQQAVTLAKYQSELNALTPQITAAKAALDVARNAYYASVGKTVSVDAELDYSNKQTLYNNKMSLYENAKTQRESARITYYNSLQAVGEALDRDSQTNTEQRDKINSCMQNSKDVNACKPDGLEALTQYAALSEAYQNYAAIAGTEGAADADIETARSRINECIQSIEDVNACKTRGLENIAQYTALETNYQSYANATALEAEQKAEMDTAKTAYDAAADTYKNYTAEKTNLNADQSTLSTAYQEKNTVYNTLLSQQQNLESQIVSLQAQLTTAGMSDATQAASTFEQFQTAKAATLSTLNEQLQTAQEQMQKNNVYATGSGKVTQLMAEAGSVVQQGGEIARIRPEEDSQDIIMCYVPVTSGKSIEPGMKVIVYPTTVNKQEYGHMEATVLSVDDYVTNSGNIQSQLGDESLVQAFTANGPVVGVTCQLRTDETTASGYYWSSAKGRSLTLAQGTMVTADIVTEEKAPITLLIPLLKEKLSVKPIESTGAAQ